MNREEYLERADKLGIERHVALRWYNQEQEEEAAERADFHARVAKAQGHPSFRRYKEGS